MSPSTSATVRVVTLLQVLSVALCQYQMPPMPPMPPMPFQFPQPQAHMAAPMVPVPPLPPPNYMPPQMPMRYPMAQKMPSVVMPYYKAKGKKSRRKKKSRRFASYDTDFSESSSREFLKEAKKRRQVLTPVVSYVTRDGYVVYQKKIKKDKAKDWLEMTKKRNSQEMESAEERKFRRRMRRRKNY